MPALIMVCPRDYRHLRHFALSALLLPLALLLLAPNVSASIAGPGQRSLETGNSSLINAAPETTDTTTAELVGHVNWQSISQPSSASVQPITLTLIMGSSEVNYPSQNTDASGFFTVSVDSLAPGTYDYRAKGPKYLANAGTVNLAGDQITPLEAGLLLTGDAIGDNVVNSVDFNILRGSFGSACGQPNYDGRADFTGDCLVSSQDFNLLRRNFGLAGAPPTGIRQP